MSDQSPIIAPFLFRGAAAAMCSDWKSDEILLDGPAGTGKTFALMFKAVNICDRWRGASVLLCRKTRTSMTESVLKKLESEILASCYPEIIGSVSRSNRHGYIFPNKSEIVLGGLDNVDRIMSTSYDAIYVFEATELELGEWEQLLTRLDRPGSPVAAAHQIIADCNPSAPSHWLKVRADAGRMARYMSRHEDNPGLHDGHDWTPGGRKYIDRLSGSLTGSRRDRLFKGLWTAAEGLVYADFDESKHIVSTAPDDLQIYRSIDWGYNVFACLWLGYGIGPHGPTVWVLDTYEAQQGTIDQHIEYLLAHDSARPVLGTFCDPAGRNRNDQTGISDIEVFRRAGIDCKFTLDPVARDVANGIQMVRRFLVPNPRLFVVRNPNNAAFIRSIESYCNRQVNGMYIDEPVKPQECDHVVDAARYFFVNKPNLITDGRSDRAEEHIGHSDPDRIGGIDDMSDMDGDYESDCHTS